MGITIGIIVLVSIFAGLAGIEIASSKGKDLVWLVVVAFAVSVMVTGMGWTPW